MAAKKEPVEKPQITESAMNNIATETKKALAGQKKYKVILPEEKDRTNLEITINGVTTLVPLGVETEVSESIYKIIQNRKTQNRMKKAMESRLIKGIELHI